MHTEYDYSVINPVVDKQKLVELAYMIAGKPLPTKGAASLTRKPVLRLRRLGYNCRNSNSNKNIYGNDTDSWRRALSASSSGLSSIQSPGQIAVRNRHEKETKTALRELGRMVRGY